MCMKEKVENLRWDWSLKVLKFLSKFYQNKRLKTWSGCISKHTLCLVLVCTSRRLNSSLCLLNTSTYKMINLNTFKIYVSYQHRCRRDIIGTNWSVKLSVDIKLTCLNMLCCQCQSIYLPSEAKFECLFVIFLSCSFAFIKIKHKNLIFEILTIKSGMYLD